MKAEQLAQGRRREGGESGPVAERYSFRRPERFDPSAVRSLEAAHEIFTRKAATALGTMLRSVVHIEPLAVDQLSYDDYLRAMPSPNMLAIIGLAPLPTPVLIEVNLELALALLDRLLGGGASGDGGVPTAARRPTDIESALLADLVGAAVPAVEEALSAFLPVAGEVTGVEYNPQLLQIAAPADSVLLLTFALRVTQGMAADGLLTVCYPAGALTPLLERVASQLQAEKAPDAGDPAWTAALVDRLEGVDVDLRVTLEDSAVSMAELAALQVGDVLRLDHRVDRAVRGRVGATDLFRAHVGRRGRRLAVQIAELGFDASQLMPSPQLSSDPAHRSQA